MDLSQQAIHNVIHPTAAFSENSLPKILAPAVENGLVEWGDSSLNPKNRIESLEIPKNCSWRIDGCTGFGSQFYAVPLFIKPLPPVRVDVFLPEPATLPPDMRRVLDIDDAFHTRDSHRVSQLGITRHVIRILHYWTSTKDDHRSLYNGAPFGSRIVFGNFPKNVAETKIQVVFTYYLERQLLSSTTLQGFWDGIVNLPPSIHLFDLEYISQLHDSVCLVKHKGETHIFKALTSYPKYLYHELKQLLLIPPHPNIMAAPTKVVTKKCGFGGKLAVVGFLLDFHPYGSLRDLLPFLHAHGKMLLEDETKWACQLASALCHIRETTGTFYPDLRLDNIVLSKSQDLIMVDFEQRGVWCEFAAPEVNAIEYTRLLAIDNNIPLSISDKYGGILNLLVPEWVAMEEGEGYSWPNEGYNVPWTCLTSREQESCEVYMLGRVLWCIFEAVSAPQRAAVWLSYRWEPAVEFPGYTRTPPKMRDLIDRCTRGRRPGLSKFIVRERNQLVLRDADGSTRLSSAAEVQATAREWWKKEIQASENWIVERGERMMLGTWNENYYERPTLKEVRDELVAFREEQGFEDYETSQKLASCVNMTNGH